MKVLTLLPAEESAVVEGRAEAIAIVETVAQEAVAVSVTSNTIAKAAHSVAVGWDGVVNGGDSRSMVDSGHGGSGVNSGNSWGRVHSGDSWSGVRDGGGRRAQQWRQLEQRPQVEQSGKR
ncbi:hypothetical protein MTO96_019682 [Rhipicephalus appendiculatus]